MVALKLLFTADLVNLTNLQPQGGFEDPNSPYYFKVKCTNCGETTKKESCVMFSTTLLEPSGQDTVHLVQRCKFCSRVGTVAMYPSRSSPLTLENAQNGTYARLMTFECKGLEPVDFSFGGLWTAESTRGTSFAEIDLSEGREFEEVCDVGNMGVSVSRLRYKVEVSREWNYYGNYYGYYGYGDNCRYLWDNLQ